MAYAATNPLDIPPYQLQTLIDTVFGSPTHEDAGRRHARGASVPPIQVRSAQALGSEIYIGCSNGELLRFVLQADDPNQIESYSLLSRQSLPSSKPIDELVLVPSISRALILADRQIYFYTLPSLDPVPSNIIAPIRNVITFAVDDDHLRRPPPPLSCPPQAVDPIEFCVVKRSNISMYALSDRLFFQKEISSPQGASVAKRTGRAMCIADKEFYNVIDLNGASLIPILPISQAFTEPGQLPLYVKPSITVVTPNEFLILSWTGASTLGLFITGSGDPVRGTLEWSSHPVSLCLDYPYITTLLPNGTIDIHGIESQAIVQVVPAPGSDPAAGRMLLAQSPSGYLVPSKQRSDKMRTLSVPLLRTGKDVVGEDEKEKGASAERRPSVIQPI